MKKVFSAALLLSGILAAHHAQADCTYPVAPGKFPDGNVASREEMLATKKEVTQYDADMKTYLGCIRSELDARIASQGKVSKAQMAEMERVHTQKEDAALAEVQDVVDRFNEQIKAWKARNPAEKKAS